MEVSIHELLAAAREAVKSDYIKGESILCETRYHPDTHYMVEIEMLKTDNSLGKKGAYIRKFLTEDEYSAMLQKQEQHLIKIKRQAIVRPLFKKEHCIISLSRTGWTAAGRGIFFNRLRRTGSVPQAAAV